MFVNVLPLQSLVGAASHCEITYTHNALMIACIRLSLMCFNYGYQSGDLVCLLFWVIDHLLLCDKASDLFIVDLKTSI